MSIRKNPALAASGRKSAYVARNRLSILKATQKVLAEEGAGASIDQFAEVAAVSVSTIYKHFENKEALIAAAFLEAFRDWEDWCDLQVAGTTDPLEELVLPMRYFLRLKRTHPLYAQMNLNNLALASSYMASIEIGLLNHISELSKKKILNIQDTKIRVRSVSACVFAALVEQLTNPDAKESDADKAIQVILGILGLSDTQAKQLSSSKIPNLK